MVIDDTDLECNIVFLLEEDVDDNLASDVRLWDETPDLIRPRPAFPSVLV
jgi:hypothetical protein